MHIILFTNNAKLCNIIIDKGNKYFASILMHANKRGGWHPSSFCASYRPNIYLATCKYNNLLYLLR